ncbi:hypothetical protein Tco_0529829 [Tanacetum coccineum]
MRSLTRTVATHLPELPAKVNKARVTMSFCDVRLLPYTSVYTDFDLTRAIGEPEYEEISVGAFHDEDEREPMFIQAHDPDYVPEPIYPEYIPLEDDHEFPAEEQPLPPIDSPTTELTRICYLSRIRGGSEEYEDDETEDGLV